jgi:hypothetical protein
MLTGSENDWEVIESGLAIGYHGAFAGHSMVMMTQHLADKGFAQVGVSWSNESPRFEPHTEMTVEMTLIVGS